MIDKTLTQEEYERVQGLIKDCSEFINDPKRDNEGIEIYKNGYYSSLTRFLFTRLAKLETRIEELEKKK